VAALHVHTCVRPQRLPQQRGEIFPARQITLISTNRNPGARVAAPFYL